MTAADQAAHRLIARELAACIPLRFPPFRKKAPFRRSKNGESGRILAGRSTRWHHKEFISGNGEFTINIALIADGCPVLGVVAAPALDVVYLGGRDRGVWRRHDSGPSTRIHAAAPPPTFTRVVESRSHPTPELEAFVASIGPVERIKLGSSLKFCRLAEGRADLYPRFGRTMEWDVAAGDCLYRYATRDGSSRPSPLIYNQPTLSIRQFVIGERSMCASPDAPRIDP